MLVGLMQFGGQPPDRLVRVLGERARRRGMQSHRAPAGAKGATLPLFDVAAVSRKAGFVSSVSPLTPLPAWFCQDTSEISPGGSRSLRLVELAVNIKKCRAPRRSRATRRSLAPRLADAG